MLAVVRKLLPAGVKCALQAALRRIKAPRMVYGYRDASGAFRERTRISDTALLYHPENIFLSDNVFVGHYNILDGTGRIDIGEGTQFAAWVGIFTHSSHIAIRLHGDRYLDVPEYEKKGYQVEPIQIGKYVYVGAGAKVLPGVTIGDGALVSAGSLVLKDVAAFEIVSGVPAKAVGDTRKMDEPFLQDPQLLESYSAWRKS